MAECRDKSTQLIEVHASLLFAGTVVSSAVHPVGEPVHGTRWGRKKGRITEVKKPNQQFP